MSESMLRWPAGVDRTPADERKSTSKFDVGFSRTKKEIRKELQRMGAGKWNLDTVTGSGDDPGVVLRWIDGGDEYAIACDAYASKANTRALYLWIEETRKRSNRPIETAQDDFAAAALPSADDDAVAAGPPPHEVLEVAPDASEETIKAVARRKLANTHPDNGGDEAEYKRIQNAKKAMLSEVDDAPRS